jgi:voltage-gated potassium channel
MTTGRRHWQDSYWKHNAGLWACIFVLLLVMLVGTEGYHFIEGWSWWESFYMTIITVSTVGYGEVHGLSPEGRIFTILLICVGVGVVAWAASVVFKTIVQRQIRIFMEKRGMQKEINRISDHIIVCGYGRMGRRIANELLDEGRDVVVIESDQQQAGECERDGILVVQGDANEEDVLLRAGLERAATLVATLQSDADNLFLTLTARGMGPDLDIIARIEDESSGRKFKQAGASRVVAPLMVGSSRIIRLITRPDIVDFVELIAKKSDIKFEVSRIEVSEGSEFAGRTLAEGRVRQAVGGMVLSIQHDGGQIVFDPSPDLRIDIGDTLYVARSVRQ